VIERDLFGSITLVRAWGQIATNGRELVQEFATEGEAAESLEALARTKRRRGYWDLQIDQTTGLTNAPPGPQYGQA
jgi:predicted DNA-binding WGR domain protein